MAVTIGEVVTTIDTLPEGGAREERLARRHARRGHGGQLCRHSTGRNCRAAMVARKALQCL